MANGTAESLSPAYAPYSTFTTCLSRWGERGVPPRIDKSTLVGSNGTKSTLRGTFRFLALIDDEANALPLLRKLVEAFGTAAWTTTLKGVLLSAYEDILSGLDLQTATTEMLSERFGERGLKGQVRVKAMRFMLIALKEAGVELSPHLKVQNSSGSTSSPGTRRRSGRRRGRNEDEGGGEGLEPVAGSKMHAFQLRRDFETKILLPEDFNASDRERLTAFLSILVFDEE